MYGEMPELWILTHSTIEHLIFRREEVQEAKENNERVAAEEGGEIPTPSQSQLLLLNLYGETSKLSSDKWLYIVLNL
jgi:hypothetical protein